MIAQGKITEENKGIFVRDIVEKSVIESVFLVTEKFFGTGKNGKTYLAMQLGDKTGTVDSRVWENAEAIQLIVQVGDAVRIKATAQGFQGRLQLVVHKVEKLSGDDIEPGLLVMASKRPSEEMYQQLIAIVDGLESGPVQELLKSTLDEPAIKKKLLTHPAAKTIHHAYQGGLLEHILSISELMVAIQKHYLSFGIKMELPLLIFGAIYHDIGKLWELDGEGPYSYTSRGRLLGHMMIALEMIDKRAVEIDGFNEVLIDKLKHIVLSHHGKLEYGSPKEPMFLEAMVVAMVDDFDSKVAALSQFVEGERQSGAEWSRLHPQFGRFFLLR